MINFWDKAIQEGDFMSRCLKDKLFFKLNYGYALSSLYELSHNPFMPPEISEKFQLITLRTLPEITEEDKKDGYAVATSSVNMIELDDKETVVGKFNGQDITLKDFMNNYVAVKDTIKQWLKVHNVDDSSLNF